MPVLRNPFRKSVVLTTEAKPTLNTFTTEPSPTTITTTAPFSGNITAATSIVHKRERSIPSITIFNRRKEEEPDVYKLCVVNDSGVYLPPSPTEDKGFWRNSPASSLSSSFRDDVLPNYSNNNGFTISRESFDSYRRSFDISAKSPITDSSRSSFDRRSSHSSRTSLDSGPHTPSRQSFEYRLDTKTKLPSHDEEDEFKDIDLNETNTQPRKRGFLSRLAGTGENTTESHSHHSWGKAHGRSRSDTVTWKKDLNKEAEELGSISLKIR